MNGTSDIKKQNVIDCSFVLCGEFSFTFYEISEFIFPLISMNLREVLSGSFFEISEFIFPLISMSLREV